MVRMGRQELPATHAGSGPRAVRHRHHLDGTTAKADRRTGGRVRADPHRSGLRHRRRRVLVRQHHHRADRARLRPPLDPRPWHPHDHHKGAHMTTTHDQSGLAPTFPTDPTGLDECLPTPTVTLAHGDTYDLHITPVAKPLGGNKVRMLAYNGSIPGPTLRVAQGSEIGVHVRNDGDTEATVHWHGLRLENRFDGVPH